MDGPESTSEKHRSRHRKWRCDGQKMDDMARHTGKEENNGGARKGGSLTQKQNTIDGNGGVIMKTNKIK